MSTCNIYFVKTVLHVGFPRKIIEPAYEIIVLITSVTSEGSGEPAHLCSLTRAFTVCTHEVWK